jgi:hypothetical protein
MNLKKTLVNTKNLSNKNKIKQIKERNEIEKQNKIAMKIGKPDDNESDISSEDCEDE